jgi:hypothetical protein
LVFSNAEISTIAISVTSFTTFVGVEMGVWKIGLVEFTEKKAKRIVSTACFGCEI